MWTHHLHVVEVAQWGEQAERLFRDWLVRHPQRRDEYARLKRGLARESPDALHYLRSKTGFVQEVVDAARSARGMPRVIVWAEDPGRVRDES